MSKSAVFRFFGNIKIPTVMAIVGLFMLLVGYGIGNGVVTASGWILVIFGGGWFLVLGRMRIYRLPLIVF